MGFFIHFGKGESFKYPHKPRLIPTFSHISPTWFHYTPHENHFQPLTCA